MAAVNADLARRLAEELRSDREFGLLSRYWTGRLRLGLGEDQLVIELADGTVVTVGHGRSHPGPDTAGQDSKAVVPGEIGLSGPWSLWEEILAPVPRPFFNDIAPAQALGLVFSGPRETYYQYYPALRRLIEILRSLAPVGAA